ncbi:hypothetical protein LTR17_016603 [Elasticomyces elasticus]|nr:hypothetical protein LTR17_016603 [Elasticomyces elasticus]
MPCAQDGPDHTHIWPQSGPLVIDRCEIYCQYCREAGDKALPHKFAWFLRRHVKGVHIKNGRGTHPNVVLAAGWTGKEDGSKTLVEKKQSHTRNKKSLSLSLTPSPPPTGHAGKRDMSEASFNPDGQLDALVGAHSSGEELPYDDYVDLFNAGPSNQQPAGPSSEDEHHSEDGFVIVRHASDEQQSNLDNALAAVSGTYGEPDLFPDMKYPAAVTCALSALETNNNVSSSGLTYGVGDSIA